MKQKDDLKNSGGLGLTNRKSRKSVDKIKKFSFVSNKTNDLDDNNIPNEFTFKPKESMLPIVPKIKTEKIKAIFLVNKEGIIKPVKNELDIRYYKKLGYNEVDLDNAT